LGTYWMMLATEYKLLKDNNQDVTETLKELFYSLDQFNKMDAYAETYKYKKNDGTDVQGTTGNLNGFFVRDIVLDDVEPNNYIGDASDPNSNYAHFNSGIVSTQVPTVFRVHSDFNTGIYPAEISQDQVAFILGGLALIRKFIDPSVTYNNIPFWDGQLYFYYEAYSISNRIISRMAGDSWCIKNPVVDEPAVGACDDRPATCPNSCGSSSGPWSYGFAAAANKIYDFSEPSNSSYYQNTESYLSFIFWQPIANGIIGPGDVGDVTTIGVVGNTFSIEQILNMGTSGFQWESLLHAILWNEEDDEAAIGLWDSFYLTMLNSAPECGPYNYVNGVDGIGGFFWNTPSALRFPEKWGLGAVGNGISPGEYNGIDYMLLHNLYYVAHEELYPALNLIDLPINNINFPIIFLNNQCAGCHSFPGQFTAFNTLTAQNNILLPDADMTYRAGFSIDLLSGFEVQEGADFFAYTELVTCDNNTGYSRMQGDSSITLNNMIPYLPTNNANLQTRNTTAKEETKYKASPSLVIMPNPNNGTFTAMWPEISTNSQIEIFDILGNVIYSGISDSHSAEISLEGISKGIYSVKVTTQEGIIKTAKFMIQ